MPGAIAAASCRALAVRRAAAGRDRAKLVLLPQGHLGRLVYARLLLRAAEGEAAASAAAI